MYIYIYNVADVQCADIEDPIKLPYFRYALDVMFKTMILTLS